MNHALNSFLKVCIFTSQLWMSDLWGADTNISAINIEQKPAAITSAYSQIYSVLIQSIQPESLQIGNGTYAFNYMDGSKRSFLLELGWAPRLFEWFGAFYLEEQFAFSNFHGSTTEFTDLPSLNNTAYSLFLFGLDSRLMYAATWFPWKLCIPFLDGGYQYSVLYQTAASGLEAAQLGVGNLVAAVGIRLWLNRDASLKGSPPFFLLIRLNSIFSNSGNLNLGSTSVGGGLSLGI